MIHAVTFDLNKNIRLFSFEEADGRIYVLLLMWDQTVDPDKKIGVVSDMTKYKGKEKLKVNGD